MQAHPMKKPFYVLELQRRNRQNPTPAETILWQELRGAKLEGVRFLRQKAFGRYIADFYCAQARLIIELDGSVHDTMQAQEYDSERTRELEARGLKVIRFQNEAVLKNTTQVLETVRTYIQARRY
jgi:very-short-patch-repair endonuclease